MPSPRLSFFLYAAIVLILSLGALWFAVFFGSFKVLGIFEDLGPTVRLPSSPQTILSFATTTTGLFWPVNLIVIALLCLGLLPQKLASLRSIARIVTVAASPIVLVLMLIVSEAVFHGMHEAYFAQHMRSTFFQRQLEAFALREAAELRLAEFEAKIEEFNELKPFVIADPSKLPPADAKVRIASLLQILSETKSLETKKKLFATALAFRMHISKSDRDSKIIAESANSLGGEQFESATAFFDWLAPKVGTDGWEPIPLYGFGIPSKKQ